MLQYISTHFAFFAMLFVWLVTLIILVFVIIAYRGCYRHFAKRLKREREFYNILEDKGNEGYLVTSKEDLEPLYVGGNIQNIFGLDREQILKDVEYVFQNLEKEERQKIRLEWEAWDHRGTIRRDFQTLHPPTQEKKWIEMVLVDAGAYDVFMFRDITTEKEQLQRMEKEIDTKEQENQSKTMFLSNMSHEIRTPMNGIMGMISLAQINIEQTEQASGYLSKAESLAQYLLSLINDILDVSRIESGKVELEAESFDVYGVADKLRSMFQGTIEEKGVTFDLKMEDITQRYLVGDEMRLNQVIINFISNAIKFTPAGGLIEITFRQMHILDGKVHLMIRVRDTGKGIEPEFLSRIFKPFEQESTKVTKKYGGSGLGMNIADNLIRMMGGQIVVDSEIGKGTDFTVYVALPIGEKPEGVEESAGGGKGDAEPFTFEGLQILMAEDNDINAEVAMEMLEMMGASVERAINGIEVVEKFAASETGRYQLIFMDVQMPEMNGYDATRRIRALQRADASTIPIFALSADSFVEDKRHAVEVGMNGHIAKPIDFNELEKTVAKFFS